MKKVDHIGSLMAILVVSTLLTCIFYRSVIFFIPFQQVEETIILANKTDNTSALDTQLFYEEREGKDKAESFCDNNESKTKIFFICVISEIPITCRELQNNTLSNNSNALGDVSRTPLYLFNRSILI